MLVGKKLTRKFRRSLAASDHGTVVRISRHLEAWNGLTKCIKISGIQESTVTMLNCIPSPNLLDSLTRGIRKKVLDDGFPDLTVLSLYLEH